MNQRADRARVLPPEPVAGQRPFTVVSPQGNREDPWFWLRDDACRDPEVLAYLAAENDYCEAWEAGYALLVERVYDELVGRVKQEDQSAPVLERGYWYYARFEKGGEHPVHARRKGSMSAPEEILLDGNAMAAPHDYFEIGDYAVSDDNRLLAWMEDTVGRRQFVLHVRDLASGALLADGIERVSGFAWAADNRHLFYSENHPETLLSWRVRRHQLGAGTPDEVVYEEQDESFYADVERSRSGAFVGIHLHSTEASETRILAADDPAGEFRVFQPRERGHLYTLDHAGDRWVMRSNRGAPNYRLLSVPVGREQDSAAWSELLAHDEQRFIEDFLAFDGFVAVEERCAGESRIRVMPRDREDFHLPAAETPSTAWLGDNPEVNARALRYHYTSLVTPRSVYRADIDSGRRVLLKRQAVMGDFQPDNYRSERCWAPARDGERIPVSLVYRKDFRRNGTAPLYQYGYGAYGLSEDPVFSANRLSLLDRGFVFAIAHVRGGQEMGRRWYDEGRLLHKMNSFHDFIDVTRFLVAEGYAAPGAIYAAGGSAGGLLVGAVANKAPALYAGMVAAVPFVDVVNTMLDETIPLTTNEFDEWGDPRLQPWYDYMLSYSPYDNVAAREYPAMLVTTGLHDSQVQYWEPAKWVARLRAMRINDAPLLFRTTMAAGHGGRSGRFEALRETARDYAFIIDLQGATA